MLGRVGGHPGRDIEEQDAGFGLDAHWTTAQVCSLADLGHHAGGVIP